MSILRPAGERRKDGPVGLITRADTSLSDRNASLLASWGHAAHEHIGSAPPAMTAAARDIEVFARMVEQRGGIERRHVQAWHGQVTAIRAQYERTLIDLAARTANVQAATLTAGTPLADLTRRGAEQNRIYALRERAAHLRTVLVRAEHIAVNAPGWSPWQWGTPGVSPVHQQVFRAAGQTGIVPPGMAGVPFVEPLAGWGGIHGSRGRLRIPPNARFWFWGQSGTAGGFAAGMLRRGYAMAGQAAGALRAYGDGWLMSLARKGLQTAESNEDALAAFAAERGSLQLGGEHDPEVLRGGRQRPLVERTGDPWWGRNIGGEMVYRRRGDDATIALRTGLESAAEMFYFTSREMVAGMRGLGPYFDLGRIKATAQLARRLGKTPGEVGAFYNRVLHHVAEPAVLNRPQVRLLAPAGRMLLPEKRVDYAHQWPTDLWPDGAPQGTLTRHSVLEDINRAMHESGMRDRPDQFQASVEAASRAMSPGVGLAHAHDAIGLPTLFASAGYGGDQWQGLMERTIHGQKARQGEAQTVAKIAAVRRFLGPIEIGGGAYKQKVNPGTLRGALRLIESGDPRVLRSYMDYATSKANGDEHFAKTIFASMMGMGALDSERVWKLHKGLRRVRNAGQGWGSEEASEKTRDGGGQWVNTANGPRPLAYRGANEPWQEGPTAHGPGRLEWKSSAKQKSELDWVGYRVGTPLLGLAKDIKEAVRIAGDGLLDNPVDALSEAIQALPWSVRLSIAGMQIGKGTADGRVAAGLMLGGAEVAAALNNIGSSLNNIGSSHAAHTVPSGAVEPVPDGAIRSEYGMRHGHMHPGVDIFAPVGAPVVAALPGTVRYVRDVQMFESMAIRSKTAARAGAYVEIDHADGTMTRYLHLGHIDPGVVAKQHVSAGQYLGSVGSTGIKRSAPHLHFEYLGPGRTHMDPRVLIGGAP